MPHEGPFLIEGVESDKVYSEDDSAVTNEFAFPSRYSSDSNTLSSSYSTDNNIFNLNAKNDNKDDINSETFFGETEICHTGLPQTDLPLNKPFVYRRRATKGSLSTHSRSKTGRMSSSTLAKRKRKGKEKTDALLPMVWLLQQTVTGMIDAIKFWIVCKIAMNLLQKSLKGDKRKQVFRKRNGNLNSTHSPISVRALESNQKNQYRQLQYSSSEHLTPETKHLSFQSVEIAPVPQMTSVTEIQLEEEKQFSKTDQSNIFLRSQESSQILHWAVVTIECLAVIPIIIIGLCLFYILAIGLFNDIQELLQRFFGAQTPLKPDINESVPLCPYNPVM